MQIGGRHSDFTSDPPRMAPLHEHFRDKVGENHRRVGSGSPAEGARLATQGTSREEGGPPRTTERQRIGTAAGVSEDKPPPDSLQALLSTRSFLRPQRRRRRYSRAPKERKQPLSFHVRIFITLPLSLFIYLLIASPSPPPTLSLSLSLSHTETPPPSSPSDQIRCGSRSCPPSPASAAVRTCRA